MKTEIKGDASKQEPMIAEALPTVGSASKVPSAGEPLEYVTFEHGVEHDEGTETNMFNAFEGYELHLLPNMVTISRGGETTWVPRSRVWQMAPLIATALKAVA